MKFMYIWLGGRYESRIFQNPEIIFYYFFRIFNLDMF